MVVRSESWFHGYVPVGFCGCAPVSFVVVRSNSWVGWATMLWFVVCGLWLWFVAGGCGWWGDDGGGGQIHGFGHCGFVVVRA